jgi:outer membrane protein
MRRTWLLISALAVPGVVLAQSPAAPAPAAAAAPAATLTLAEALTQALAHNPQYLQQQNNASSARWALRNAYGQLLPQASVSSGMSYTGSGQANFGQGFTRQTSAIVSSNVQAGLQWSLDGSRLLAPSAEKANLRATDQEIANQENNLRFSVTNQYLTSLQATAQVGVSRQQVERQQTFLDLANAKYRVGQGTLVEVRQAEVQKAQADVGLLRAIQTENEAKLELFRQMGVISPVSVDQVALTDSFPVSEPAFQLDALIQQAADQNPALRSLDARKRAAALGVKQAKSAYLPSLFAQAGWSGFTQQQTDRGLLLSQALGGAQGSAASCFSNDSIRTGAGLTPVGNTACFTSSGLDATGQTTDPFTASLDPAVRRSLINENDKFPFDFTKQPFFASVTISLPLFTGFGRSLQLARAREAQRDAEEGVRDQALRVRADVNTRYLALQTAYQEITVQAQSREAAHDQLRLAQDRYRLGSGTALEVSDAQNAVTRAEGDYVNAIYDYHKTLAALESAVGRPLR